jgi:hypothetical protein
VYPILAVIALYYGILAALSAEALGIFWYGIGLIGVGVLSIVLACRSVNRRTRRSRQGPAGPTFASDDPEVAALPPTSMTRLRDQIKQARQQQYWEEE